MHSIVRRLPLGILTASLAAVLGACDDGGSKELRLFFGYADSSSDNDCDDLEFTIDSEAAGAVLASDPDCLPTAFADGRGCDVSFEELGGGELRVTVEQCDVSSFHAYFSCAFRDADLSELVNHVRVSCDCEDDGCDNDPPACAADSENVEDCEVCNDESDNDHDGASDCDDPNCASSRWCSLTPPSSSTTSSTGTDQPKTCDVTFRVLGEETIGSLEWNTNYANAEGGEFLGTGANVECDSLVSGSLSAFNDFDAQNRLESGIVSLQGFHAPKAVARCRFESGFVYSSEDFVISEIEAATPDLALIEPDPAIQVVVNCGEATTTTESPTTTISSPSTTDEPPTTTTLPPGSSRILFHLDSAGTTLGALQIGVNYSASGGEFAGSGGLVSCTNKVSGALFAPNDDETADRLTLGFIALSGIGAPGDLASCDFVGPTPEAGEFVVTIEDVTDANGDPASAAVSVQVLPGTN